MILVLTVVALVVVVLVGFFVKNLKKMERKVVDDLQEAQAKGENVTIPEEYNNVSLGVGSGIKFGFGFGIGLFFAGLIIAIVLIVFFGFTISSLFSGLSR
jgi:hypothetical protein